MFLFYIFDKQKYHLLFNIFQSKFNYVLDVYESHLEFQKKH